jgi:hypothetical protein
MVVVVDVVLDVVVLDVDVVVGGDEGIGVDVGCTTLLPPRFSAFAMAFARNFEYSGVTCDPSL